MLVKSRAIVFRTHKYGETSVIAELYTEEKGLRKYVINGVRSAKAKTKANLLQGMTLLEIVAYEREDRDLNRIKEIRPAFVYESIPFDVRKGAIGLFMLEVARKAIREREANPVLFHFLYDRFIGLDTSSNSIANYHLVFLIELSTYLGFLPAGRYSAARPVFDLQAGAFTTAPPEHPYYLIDEQAIGFNQLLGTTALKAHELKIPRGLRQQLLDKLVRYYQLHLEGMGEVNAHHILREVF